VYETFDRYDVAIISVHNQDADSLRVDAQLEGAKQFME